MRITHPVPGEETAMPDEYRDAEFVIPRQQAGGSAEPKGTGQSALLRRVLAVSPRQQTPAPRVARGITVVALACYCFATVINVLGTPGLSPALLVTCVATVLLNFGLQFSVSSQRARAWSLRRRLTVLGVQAALTYLPMVWFHTSWGSMQGPLGATLLLTLPPRLAWPAYGVVVAGIIPYSLLSGAGVLETCYFLVAGGLTGLVVYGLSRLADLVQELHETREQMAKMAVVQERLRFARDLHDLLGYSLSAITLKGELIQRLIQPRPDRAATETAELLVVARQALADVRLVSRGYRDMSLSEEAESARAVLAAADVRAEVKVECGRLHPVVDTVLATALREGITNMLRHSAVQVCTIGARVEGDVVRLSLVNDRPHSGGEGSRLPDEPEAGGSGLGNLRTRFAAIGGELDAGVGEDGRFHLDAWAPLRPRSTDTGVPAHDAVRGKAAV
ncbi:histidine kinase [Streptomyces sp. NPDC046197]|uniref:sensor histidine kinase n=1 Tax=Streptomyces sp. NPDC046197 TaxID=3154337 RepID=UPI00340FF7EE